jgi:hypothetical protein
MSGFQGIIGLAFTLVFCSFCMGDWLNGFKWRQLFANFGLQALCIAALMGVYGLLYGCNVMIGRAP